MVEVLVVGTVVVVGVVVDVVGSTVDFDVDEDCSTTAYTVNCENVKHTPQSYTDVRTPSFLGQS